MRAVCLVIIDGWGYSNNRHGNAVLNSSCSSMDTLIYKYGCRLVYAHGEHVGLMEGQAGNSEVGHLTIGAGRVVEQDICTIKRAACSKELKYKLDRVGLKGVGRLHFIGLVSDGGVHSHIDILKSLLLECRGRSQSMFVHFISDGRDTAPRSFEKYYMDLKKFMECNMCGSIASVCGRYYAMDRDCRHERTDKTYNMMVGIGRANSPKPHDDLKSLGLDALSSDEMLMPKLIASEGAIRESDTVFMFNYRADRMRQLTKRFIGRNTTFTLTEYDKTFDAAVVFRREAVSCTLGEAISGHNMLQTHIAESEKKAHVTYFLNGGKEEPFPGEKRVIVPSPCVKQYSETPQMSMEDVFVHVLDELNACTPFVVCNLAAPDMVGHTGNFEATCLAVEATDRVIGKIHEGCKRSGHTLIVTADHGNCEVMIDSGGSAVTKHTANKVPLIVCDGKAHVDGVVDTEFSLKDVAPTVLEYMRIDKPVLMTGTSIVQLHKKS
eukprot:jgi/Antlo1/2535/1046